jgi:uncharacterized membrane protein YfcA
MAAQDRNGDDGAMDISWWGVAAVFLLAGSVKGITGMGMPAVAMSLLGLWIGPAQAATLLVLPTLVTNIAQCIGPAWKGIARVLWPAWLGLSLATLFAPDIGALAPIDPRAMLGCILVAYGAWGLTKPVLPPVSPQNRWIGLLMGACSGFVAASTAVFVMPLVPYLQALKLDKETMIQALGLSFMIATVSLGLRLQSGGGGGGALLTMASAAGLAAALVGLVIGAAVRARIAAATFQRALFVTFIALGAANLWRAAL